MGKIFTHCPSCGNHNLFVSKIDCPQCSTVFAGQFEIHPILTLGEEYLKFILEFVKCSGSLKEMAKLQNVSYPTLRNRLNDLILKIQNLEDISSRKKETILKSLEDGQLSAKEAAKQLREL